MTSSTSHIHSTKMNLGMLRSRGMNRLKNRTRYSRFGMKTKRINVEAQSPVAVYHHEIRMKRAIAKGIRKEIVGYLLASTLLTVAAMLLYGVFFA